MSLLSFNWRRWLRGQQSGPGSRKRKHRRKLEQRPRVEELEARYAPATFQWDGGGANNNWSNALNWVNDVAPTGIVTDELIFPSGPSALVTNNDLNGATFGKITISGSGYQLSGNPLTLGSASSPNSGEILVATGATGSIGGNMDITMAVASGTRQFITVQFGAQLTISSRISSASSGVELTKAGTGTLILSANNSGFTGPFTIDNNSGIVAITNAGALGDQFQGTRIGQNSQLQLRNVAGPIQEPLTLLGRGVANDGALLNFSGGNTWAGSIVLDGDSTLPKAIGATAGTLTITGQISDLGSGHNLIKEGPGEVIFTRDNTYRGTTTINDGILTIQTSNGLGTNDGTFATSTIVNSSVTGSGTLQLRHVGATSPDAGFTVRDELITLNGPGFNGIGALNNLSGNNIWGGRVVLGSQFPNGSNVSIGSQVTGLFQGAALGLNIQGRVIDQVDLVGANSNNRIFNLTKVGTGRIILSYTDPAGAPAPKGNLYRGSTTINTGTINIRDSNALGDPSLGAQVQVNNGGALELEVDTGFNVHGVNLANDSVTGVANKLVISRNLNITGRGAANDGALRNISGINVYNGNIVLANSTLFGPNSVAVIGVEPDPNPKPDITYFTNDYSLTINGIISHNPAPFSGANTILSKRGTGHLILTNANTYTGATQIEQGWVTITNSQALGGRLTRTDPQSGAVFQLGDTQVPQTIVSSGAALHLKPTSGNITLVENLVLTGTGIATHPFSLINQKGALLNLAGSNIVGGPVVVGAVSNSSDIELNGQVGIGVENPFGGTSELTLTGAIRDGQPAAITISGNAVGGTLEDARVIDTGSTSGTITVDFDFLFVPDTLRIYYPDRSDPTSTRIFDSGLISGMGTVTVAYGPGASTFVEIVMNEGIGQPGTVWSYTATIQPNAVGGSGGLTKLGSKRLYIQGPGTFTGSVDIREGVIRMQNDTALGFVSSGTISSQETFTTSNTTVQAGAALELAPSIAQFNGGIAAGTQTWFERLTVNGSGNTTADGTLISPLTNLSDDAMWRGPVVLGATPFKVAFQGALGLADLPNMTADTSGLVGTNPSITVATSRFGASGTTNAEQTITFGGAISSGTFTLSFRRKPTDPITRTAPITWSSSPATLAANIEAALDAAFNTPFGPNTTAVTPDTTAAIIDVKPNSRLTLFGSINDSTNSLPSGSNITKVGTGELVLTGINDFRGTMTVSTGVLTVEHSRALGSTGTSEVQTVTVTSTGAGNFELGFDGQSTTSNFDAVSLPAAATVEAALNALASIGGVGGSVSVSRPLTSNVYTVTFRGTLAGFNLPDLTRTQSGGASVTIGTAANGAAGAVDGAGGTVIANNAQLQLQGSITVAGEPLTIQGTGATAPAYTPRWFGTGPAPINSAQTPGNTPATGRITGVAVDPTDPDVMYVSAAGGGAWKTEDGGITWEPLIDMVTGAPFQVMFTGAIAVAPSDPRIVYVATGEANNSGDSYYGRGIFKSTDSGRTWTLMRGNALGNEFDRRTINKIVVDPVREHVVYVAVNGSGNGINSAAGNGGIWVSDTQVATPTWRNIIFDFGGVPGDDNPMMPTVTFSANDDYTDIVVIRDPYIVTFANGADLPARPNNRILAMAIGTAIGSPRNAVYTSTMWNAASLTFSTAGFVPTPLPQPGPPTPPQTDTWTRNGFPLTESAGPQPPMGPPDSTLRNGVIKLTAAYISPAGLGPGQVSYGNPIGLIGPGSGQIRIYAAIAYPTQYPNFTTGTVNTAFTGTLQQHHLLRGTLREVVQMNMTFDSQTNFKWNVGTWGGGQGTPSAPIGTAGGTSTFVTPAQLADLTGFLGDGQGSYDLAIAANRTDLTGNTVYIAGIGRDPAGRGTVGPFLTTDGGATWTEIATSALGPHVNTHAISFDNQARPLFATGGGLWRFNGPGDWSNLNGNLAISQFNGIAVHPTDPNIALGGTQDTGVVRYSGSPAWLHVDNDHSGVIYIDQRDPRNVYHVQDGVLRKSTDGGLTWTTLNNVIGSPIGNQTSTGFYPNLGQYPYHSHFGVDAFLGISTASIGAPYFPFVLDSVNSARLVIGGGVAGTPQAFVSVYPPTYSTTGGRRSANALTAQGAALQESLDGGNTWVNLTPTPAAAGQRLDSLMAGSRPGGTSALSISFWYEITAVALAQFQGAFSYDASSFPLVTNKGDNTYDPDTIYAVVRDANNVEHVVVTKDRAQSWANRTPGLPGAGGSSLQSYYDIMVDPRNRDHVYVVRNVFGSAGTGKVFESTDAGQTWADISAGLPDLPAWKIIIDPRNSDLYLGTDNGVYKRSFGIGNWAPFGAGLPNTQVKVLELNQTLNTLTAGTYGRSMYQLFLRDGQPPSSGAIRSVSGANVWTGPLALTGATSISAGGTQALQTGLSTASLKIDGVIRDFSYSATLSHANTLTKAGQGDVILSRVNTYGGVTQINEGVLVVQNAGALGAAGPLAATFVADGAALHLVANLNAEQVNIRGPGISFNGRPTGAIRNVANNNTFTGSIVLEANSTIGVDSASSLLINGASPTITDLTNTFSLTKELTGTLILASANNYKGVTFVNQGALQIRHGSALGATGASEVQTVTVTTAATSTFSLTFNGSTTGAFDASSLPSAATVQAALNGLASIGGVGGSVTVSLSGNVYTVTFGGTLAATNVPQMTSTVTGTATVTVATATEGGGGHTVVADGAQVQIQGGITTNEPLILTGTGIVGTGALLNTGGNNEWAAPVTIITPSVALGVSYVGDELKISGIIDDGAPANLSKVGPGRLTFSGNNSYDGATTVSAGTLRLQGAGKAGNANTFPVGTTVNNGALLELDSLTGVLLNETLTLNGLGTPEAQFLDLSGTAGTFTLTFDNVATSGLAFNASAGAIQAALNGLSTIGGLPNPGSVTVTQNVTGPGPDIRRFTIIFGGSLAGVNVSLLGTNGGIGGATAATGMVTIGPDAIVAHGGQGSLRTVAGMTNEWAGPIILNTDSSFGINTGSQLTVSSSGAIRDPWLGVPANATHTASTLTKIGAGTLVLQDDNTYTGNTDIREGIVNIRNATALGLNGPEIQTVAVLGTAGTFRLRVTVPSLGSATTTPLNANPLETAANVAAALNAALATIDADITGNPVTVTLTGNVYRITFGGVLVGQNIGLLEDGGTTGGASFQAFTTIADGTGRTTVQAGAALGILNTTFPAAVTVGTGGTTPANDEHVILNGDGVAGAGALVNNSNSGFTNTWRSSVAGLPWESTILLASNSSIGSTAGTLDIETSINESTALGDINTAAVFGVTKVGAGTVEYNFNATAASTYTGLTTVNQGTLDLNAPSGNSLAGNLTIGDSAGGAATATARLLASEEIPDTATVIVQSDGRFNLNTFTETVSPVTVNGGQVTTGAAGVLNASSVTMTGGTVDIAAVGFGGSLNSTGNVSMTGGTINIFGTGELAVGGSFNATSNATNLTAVVTGTGNVNLGTTSKTFNVTDDGTAQSDLRINAPIVSTVAAGALGIVKSGNGLMEVDSTPNAGYVGKSRIDAGILQVDGQLGPIELNGGTLAGTGTVGTVTSLATPGNQVAPGNSAGNINTGAVTWNAQTTFFVELPLNPAPFDTLTSSGAVNLGGATLNGTTTAAIGDTFQILTGTSITGRFAEPVGPNVAFIGGQKFTVAYNTGAPTPNVTLSRVKNNSQITVVASSSPPGQYFSAYGQQVTLTITVSANEGIPLSSTPGGSVDIFFRNVLVADDLALNGSGVATFQIISAAAPLDAGAYNLKVTYGGDGNFNAAPDFSRETPGNQFVVNPGSTQINPLTSSANPAAFGQPVTFTATVNPVAPAAGNPTGTVTFFIDGAPVAGSSNRPISGAVTDATNAIPIVITSNNHGLLTGATVRVSGVTGNTNANGAFTVTVLDANRFSLDGTTGNAGYTGGGTWVTNRATFTHSSFGVGSNFIVTAMYNGDTNFAVSPLGSLNTNPQVVTAAPTQVALVSDKPTSTFGDQITYTATVTRNAAGTGNPNSGTVRFIVTIGGTDQAPVDVALASSNVATFHISNLPATSGTPHGVRGQYITDNGNYASSPAAGGTLAGGQTVNKATPGITVSANPASPTVFGQPVDFLVTVTPPFTGGGAPTGTVRLFDGATQIGSETLMPSGTNGVRTFTISTLSAGPGHNISAIYDGSTNFNASAPSSNLSHTVNKASTTISSLVDDIDPTIFGQPFNLTATVSVTAPGAGTPTGFVDFFSNIDGFIQTVALAGNTATLMNYRDLSGTPGPAFHNLTAVYTGDSNFNASPVSSNQTHDVTTANTSTAVLSSTLGNTSVFGQSVTFTATVSAQSPSQGTPTGSINFDIDGTVTNVALVGGQAQITRSFPGNPLSVGSHNVTATFVPTNPSNYNSSFGTLSPNQVVTKANTTTTLTPNSTNAPYGQGVITATVTVDTPGMGSPTGNVIFAVNNGTSTQNFTVGLTGNQATLNPPLNVGTYPTITARYDGDATLNQSPVSNQVSQTVTQADASIAVTPLNSSFGSPVVFTATVTRAVAGAGIPTGAVTFFVDNVQRGPSKTLSFTGGTGTADSDPVAGLNGGPHAVEVLYVSDNGNFRNAPPATTGQITHTVGTVTPTVNLTPLSSNFGEGVIFVANVTSSAGPPPGTIQFVVDGTNRGSPVNLVNGQASSIVINGLSAGNHTVRGAYTPASSNFAATSAPNDQITHTVNQIQPTVTITNANPASPGTHPANPTFTVTVTSPAGTPTGNVTFFLDGASQNTKALSAGAATSDPISIAPGSHNIRVDYDGSADPNFLNASSANFAYQVNVNPMVTVTASPPSPTVYGNAVTFNANMNSTVGAVPSGGTVTFFIDGTQTGAVKNWTGAVGGVNSDPVTNMTFNGSPHNITATYSGSGFFTMQTGATTHSINKSNTMVDVRSNGSAGPASNQFGTTTITATITGQFPAGGNPGGTVTFIVDGTTDATPTAVVNGVATLGRNLNVGVHTVEADYNGDGAPGNFNAQTTSNILNQTITPVTTTATVSGNPTSSRFGQSVVFTVTITSPGGTPTGTANFNIDSGADVQNGVPVLNGQASITRSNLSVSSTHTIRADYVPNSTNFNTSNNTLSGFTVNQANPTILLTSNDSDNFTVPGALVTFSLTVSPEFAGAATPTGTVDFFVNEVLVSAGDNRPLSGGVATFTTTALTPGENRVRALYNGDDNFNRYNSTGLSNQIVHRVDGPPVANAGGPYTVAEGNSVTFNGSLSSDPDTGDAITSYSWDIVGFGGAVDATGPTPTLTWPQLQAIGINDGPLGPITVTLTVTDTQGVTGSANTTLTVQDTPPTIVLTGNNSVAEGATYTLNLGTAQDFGNDAVSNYRINWGDGAVDNFATPGNKTHVYADDGNFNITVDLTDGDGTHLNRGNPAPKQVTVTNVATFLSGTLADTLVKDVNGNGLADPGDVIQYSAAVTNSGPDNATSVTYQASLDANTSLVPGSIPASSTVVFSDNFNRADNSLGANWTKQASNADTSNNMLLGIGGAGLPLNVNTVNGVNDSDVRLEASFDLGTLTTQAGLVARYQGTGDTNLYYGAVWGSNGNRRAGIWRNVATSGAPGTWTLLTSIQVFQNSGLLRFEAFGPALRLFLDGNLLVSALDSTFRTGQNGVRLFQNAKMDDFSISRVVNPLLDNFNRADSGDLGGSYKEVAGVGDFVIQAGQARAVAGSPVNLAAITTSAVADVSIAADVDLVTNSFSQAGLVARYSGAGDTNMYVGTVQGTPGNYSANIYRNFNNTWTRLSAESIASPRGNLRFDVLGSAMKLYLNEGLVGTAVDSMITSAGLAGIRGFANSIYDNLEVNPIASNLPFSDGFDRVDNGNIGARFSERVGNFAIEGARLKAVDPLNPSTMNVAAYLDSWHADTSTQADINLSGTGVQAGLIARYQGTGDRDMYVGLVFGSTGNFAAAIFKNVGGIWTRLSPTPLAIVSGTGTLRFEVQGNALRLFFNGTLVSSVTDNSITGPGFTGVRGKVNQTWDNFSTTALGGTTVSAGGTNFLQSLGTLTPGQTVNVVYRAAVNNPLPANVNQVGHQGAITGVDSGTGVGYTPASTNAVTESVNASADLRVTLTGPAQVKTTDDIVYTLTYTNLGNQDDTGVRLRMSFPFNMSVQGGSFADGTAATWTPATGQTFDLVIGHLPVRASRTVTLVVRFNQTVPGTPRDMTVTATILDDGLQGADLNAADNTRNHTTNVTGPNDPFTGI